MVCAQSKLHAALSMRDWSTRIFAAHGEFTIRSCGRVVRVDTRGPWNRECTLDYARELRICIERIPTPFGVLMVSHEQPILGPEGEEILRLSVRERVAFGCAVQATVLLERSTAGIARVQYQRVYVPERLQHAIFQAIAPAKRWLIDHGFTDVKGLCRNEETGRDAEDAAA